MDMKYDNVKIHPRTPHDTIRQRAWRRDNKRGKPSTVAEAAKHFKTTPENIADIVGIAPNTNKNNYFYIVGDSRKMAIAEMDFQHDGE